MEEGTTIELTEQDVEAMGGNIDTSKKYSEEFCLTPNDEDQTIIIGAMGKGDILKLSKRKARILAEIILHLLQRW